MGRLRCPTETSKEPDIGSAEPAVTMHVFPSETTTYTQVAENDAGSVGATVEVLVERDHVRLNNLDRWIKKLENGDHPRGKGRER